MVTINALLVQEQAHSVQVSYMYVCVFLIYCWNVTRVCTLTREAHKHKTKHGVCDYIIGSFRSYYAACCTMRKNALHGLDVELLVSFCGVSNSRSHMNLRTNSTEPYSNGNGSTETNDKRNTRNALETHGISSIDHTLGLWNFALLIEWLLIWGAASNIEDCRMLKRPLNDCTFPNAHIIIYTQ